MSFFVRRLARTAAATAIVLGTMGTVGVIAPAAHAVSVLWYPTNQVWTGPSALSQCTTAGKQRVAEKQADGYSCRSDPSVSPSAIQLWVGFFIGCPTCVPIKAHTRHS